MKTHEDAGDAFIEVPLMAAYGACLVARREGRAGDADALLQALAGIPLKGDALGFSKMAASGMQEALIPFLRDALDVHVVSACMPTGRFFSEASFIDVGFFWVGRHGAVYLDKLPVTEQKLKAAPELLEPARVVELLTTLVNLDERSVMVRLPTDASDALFEISDAVMGEYAGGSSSLDVEVFLVRADSASPSGAVRRRLAAAKTQQAPQGSHEIRLRTEHTMEVHAAAMAGHWLLVETAQFRLLAPLPDFSQEGAGVEAWLQPTQAFGRALGERSSATVQLDTRLAQRLMQRHRWFAPIDATRWFSAVQHLAPDISEEVFSKP